ncbi:MAG: ABC transporter substrate-binding protein [Chloroflexota bacterium]
MRTCVALLMALAFVGVGVTPASGDRGKVTIVVFGEPPTMDPHVISDATGNMVWRWSYDSLLSSETGSGKVVPWLAEKWEKIGPTAFKFWLRKGVKFPDGSPLTVEAVKYSMERVLKSPVQGPYFKSIDRMEVLDDYTFIWHTKGTDNGLPNRLVRWVYVMSPKTKGLDSATLSRNTFGSGPYILKEWTKSQKMVFEANPTWWANDRHPNRPKTLVLRNIPEGANRVNALVTGEVDLLMGVMPHIIPTIENNPATRAVSIPAVQIMFLGFVSRHGGPFADPKVRLAVNYAIDAETVRKTILGGRAGLFGQLLHPWVYSGYNPEKEWHGHDLEKAKTLMKESGYPQGFKAELITTGDGRIPGDRAVCEAAVGMLKKIDIDIACKPMNFALYRKTFTAYQTGKQEGAAMYYMGFGGAAGDSANTLTALVACEGYWSGTCYPDLDAAIHEAYATADPKEQQLAFEKVTDIMKERATHKVLVKLYTTFGFRKDLEIRPRHDDNVYPWEIGVK